ncbi:Signal transduction histidine kinase [Promicromonospora umidemergens]|uniref:histidine kinase n=1 Tax=Promicromonospora umidemergens TaxID=629679 RepID=A0ABP8XG34_9MICO|nr:histidine kinase [Promicromonospora umidemergens]MCP2283084.1 Signal transduction histidine kinase [Promicromonospora umidemergens]
MLTTDGPAVFDDVTVPPRTSRLGSMLDRLGVTGRLAQDGLLAALVMLVTAGMMAVLFEIVLAIEGVEIGSAQGVVLAVVSCAQALPLVVRRVRPLLCLGLVVACQVAIIAATPPEMSNGGIPQFIAAYTVGTLLPPRRAVAITSAAVAVGVFAALVVSAAAGVSPLLPVAVNLFQGLVAYVVGALVGGAVATRRSYVDLLRLRAADLVRTQQATTRAAIVAERSRMARELHDVAAHHLSGLVVQAAAVERQIDSDPAAAKKGTAWIRGQGKETLDSLRLIVGVLRERPSVEDDGHDAPPPGLAALDGLLRTARTLGTTVDLVRAGRPRELAPIADAAFYRVAQESLSNARQHAPGAALRMAVRFGEREVSLEVVNEPVVDGTPTDSTRRGMGLIGMGERAQLVGATLTTGVTPSGGWRVLLTLPLHHEPGSTVSQGAADTPALTEGGQG